MKEDPLFDIAETFSFDALKRARGKVENLPAALQTFVRIYAAQGVIDNGGLEYFYESNWPGMPSYSAFSDAYRTIGAVRAARCIEETAEMFQFDRPERSRARRDRAMAELLKKKPSRFEQLSNRICGDESVWTKLQSFVRKNRGAFCS